MNIGQLAKVKHDNFKDDWKLFYKDGNIYHFENTETEEKTSYIYGLRHPTQGYLTGEVNPNIREIK